MCQVFVDVTLEFGCNWEWRDTVIFWLSNLSLPQPVSLAELRMFKGSSGALGSLGSGR